MSPPNLLTLPWDNRHAIWVQLLPETVVHLSLIDSYRLVFSPCDPVKPRWMTRNDEEREEGSGRSFTERLTTPWGPHWRCEELDSRHKGPDSDAWSLMMTCKTLFEDMVGIFTEGAIHFVGLDALECLAFKHDQLTAQSRGTAATVLRYIRRVHVTLKVSLEFCKALEPRADTAGLDDDCQELLSSWRLIGKTLSHFENISSLHVWIDHSCPDKWESLDERSITAQLQGFAKGLPGGVDVTIQLPWLHPWHEDVERHFTEEEPLTKGFQIPRFIRHRKFVVPNIAPYIFEVEDFPYLAYDSLWWVESFPDPASLMAEERSSFAQGIDVAAANANWQEEISEICGQDCSWPPKHPEHPRPLIAHPAPVAWSDLLQRHNRLHKAIEEPMQVQWGVV
ncbi:hypothetical protein Micbo1qcDRAFT_203660 [Microdochium bolleyi]|uniref:Uncharacterized protein n=1 Tax=Microdochium bolleyi TaxID=196109 RepID=A0A136J940_9PEZI|nr:hypothetical protein Micbo1qcDRAFT_203660 [Microdochium bolleyi]